MAEPESIVEHLERSIYPLSSTDPGIQLTDLLGFADTLEDRMVVGLGEATHGSREFFRLKHRIIRLLVEELDFRTVGFESNFAETLALNDYVASGKGSPKEALEGIYFWTWYTEEILDLLEWIRSFNRDRPPTDRVRFYGVDIQYTAGAVAELTAFLNEHRSEALEEFKPLLTRADDDGRWASEDENALSRIEAAEKLVEELGAYLDHHKVELHEQTTKSELSLAYQHLRTISQAAELKRTTVDENRRVATAVRDRAMADNVSWIHQREHTDRLVLWAHNDHINRLEIRPQGKAVPSMGAHLADRFGDAYYALGFEFGGGSFLARGGSSRDGGRSDSDPGEQTLKSPLSGTIGETFSTVGHDVFLLDIDTLSANQVLGDWLQEERGIHSIGAVYFEDTLDSHCEQYPIAETFDGLAFIDSTEPSRLIANG